MPDVQSAFREEIRRLARKEVRSELQATRKAVAQHRREIAGLKRMNKALEQTVSYLQSRETKRLKAVPAKTEPPCRRARHRRSARHLTVLARTPEELLWEPPMRASRPRRAHARSRSGLRGLRSDV